jgi:hypothetical protein
LTFGVTVMQFSLFNTCELYVANCWQPYIFFITELHKVLLTNSQITRNLHLYLYWTSNKKYSVKAKNFSNMVPNLWWGINGTADAVTPLLPPQPPHHHHHRFRMGMHNRMQLLLVQGVLCPTPLSNLITAVNIIIFLLLWYGVGDSASLVSPPQTCVSLQSLFCYLHKRNGSDTTNILEVWHIVHQPLQ